MSRHHYTHSEEASSIFHNIQHLSWEELQDLYGIEILPKGEVYDPIAHKIFKSLTEWADEEIREEKWTESEHGNVNGRKFNDDF